MLEDVGEISEILGRSYGMPDGIEEEDLDAELACLEDEWAAEEISTSNGVTESNELADPSYNLPAQPNQAINTSATAANPPQVPLTNAPSYI